jgi:hypothetical protein
MSHLTYTDHPAREYPTGRLERKIIPSFGTALACKILIKILGIVFLTLSLKVYVFGHASK